MTQTSTIKDIINRLNRECDCLSLDPDLLRQNLRSTLDDVDLYQMIEETRPHLFSPTMVFINPEHITRMRSLIVAIHQLSQQSKFQQEVLSWAPAIAHTSPGNSGVFYGYDFHLDENGPQLIEINSNAGGALLNIMLARAQRACCPEIKALSNWSTKTASLENSLVTMFQTEWQKAGHLSPLKCIAIVDDQPESQYLYPEFVLFQRLFEKNGIRALITDPGSLEYRNNRLWFGEQAIDMVYNRLTDFSLAEASHQILHSAYQERAVVLTPHPHGYALLADKRNLVVLSDVDKLKSIGIDNASIDILCNNIAHTSLVTVDKADYFWSLRKQFFFKPATGYGSKAVYRGDKLTRGVWDEILAGNYVAQRFVKPTERKVRIDNETVNLKFDIRCYVYESDVQLIAARLYQGQATNFRTTGGGFAPVYY